MGGVASDPDTLSYMTLYTGVTPLAPAPMVGDAQDDDAATGYHPHTKSISTGWY